MRARVLCCVVSFLSVVELPCSCQRAATVTVPLTVTQKDSNVSGGDRHAQEDGMAKLSAGDFVCSNLCMHIWLSVCPTVTASLLPPLRSPSVVAAVLLGGDLDSDADLVDEDLVSHVAEEMTC